MARFMARPIWAATVRAIAAWSLPSRLSYRQSAKPHWVLRDVRPENASSPLLSVLYGTSHTPETIVIAQPIEIRIVAKKSAVPPPLSNKLLEHSHGTVRLAG